MAKDEAKIRFTAETTEFNQAIKQANATLTSMRAALKLNEAELKNTGDKTEYLKNKHNVLKTELEANRQKQEALNSKLEAAVNIFGEDSLQAQKLSAQLTNLKADEQKLQTQVTECENAMQEQEAEAKQEQTALEKLTSEIDQQENQLRELKTEYANVALEQGKDSSAAQELKSDIDQLNSELEQNEDKLRDVTDAANESASAAESGASGGWSIAKQIFADLASEAIQECIEKLKEFATEVVSLGIDFSSSMSNVQALSGATDAELEQLETTARELGSSTIFSASEVADAFSYMALAGWDTEDMLNGIDGVLNLAAAADMDLADASDIVTDNLTAFGLSAQDSAAFVDQMAYAMANSNTNVEQLGEAYKNCASTASSMGFSVEDTTAALMTMANAGVKGGEAGTGLSSIMTRLATDTKDCATELGQYGVEVYDSQGNLNDLSSILNGCSDIWGDLTDKEQANLAKTIAGTSQYSKFQTVMEGLSEETEESGDSFNDYTDALEDVKTASEEGQSAAEDMADTMQDNLGGDLKTTKSKVEELGLSIYDKLETPLRDAVDVINSDAIPALSSLVDNFDTIGPLLLGAATAAIVFAAAVNFGSIVTAVTQTLTKMKGAVILLNGALTSNPIALVVALIAGLVVALVTLWNTNESFRNAVISVWNALKSKVGSAINAVKSAVSGLGDKFNEIKTSITTAVNNIRTAVSNGFNKVKTTVTTVSNSIKTTAKTAWTNIKTAITTPVTSVVSTVKTKFNTMKTNITNTFNSIKSKTTSVFNAVKSAITSPVESARAKVKSTVDKIKGYFSNLKLKIPKFTLPSMPHFSLKTSSKTVLGKTFTYPTGFSVAWYAKAMNDPVILNSPTVFGQSGNTLLGAGEAGSEVVAGTDTLMTMIQNAVSGGTQSIDVDELAIKIAGACANQNIIVKMDKREFGRMVKEVS